MPRATISLTYRQLRTLRLALHDAVNWRESLADAYKNPYRSTPAPEIEEFMAQARKYRALYMLVPGHDPGGIISSFDARPGPKERPSETP